MGLAGAQSIVRRGDRVSVCIGEGIGVDDAFRDHNVPVDSLAPDVTALGRAHAVVKDASRAEVYRTKGRRKTPRPPPLFEPFGLRPRLEYNLPRRVDEA